MNGSLEELASLQQALATVQDQVRELQARAALEDASRALSEQSVWDVSGGISTVWLLACAALVFFMQAGFALVEAGSCRMNNALSILMKNQVDFLVSSVAWYLFGWGLGFGNAKPTSGLAGTSEFLGGAVIDGEEVSDSALAFHFQQMFCAVAATIVSGGIAERADLKGYMLFSFVMASFIYPFVVCWCWNEDGWLAVRGFSDFAGSGVVHLTGGMGALAGACVLGPRVGRFESKQLCQDSHEFQPHSVPFIALGTMILHFGWYGFNAGSTLGMSSEWDMKLAALASVNTTMAAVAGGATTTLVRLFMKRRWDVPYVCNGFLAGLVSITACCHCVRPLSAVVIGSVGGMLFCVAASALQWQRIDDPIGAFPVHGLPGFWGLLAVSLFHSGVDVLGGPAEAPDLYVQSTGAAIICVFSGIMCLLFFSVLKRIGVLSSSLEDQRRGLDRKFGDQAYGSKGVSRYRYFISHAKSSHGATARWLQLELARCAKGKSHVFLDSDNLVNLTHLLGTVREKVDVLVVLATRDIWWRPWCAGEIAVASSANVPVVLVMMHEEGQPVELDFDQISSDVRKGFTPEALAVLAPFGIGHEEIERAYSGLAAAWRVPFGPFFGKRSRQAMSQVVALAETAASERQGSARPMSWARKLNRPRNAGDSAAHAFARRLGRKAKPNYLVICDTDDIEAVAASHICAKAMLEVTNEDSDFRIASCAGMSEAKVLQLVSAGAILIFVLSKDVLASPLVQRVCLVRAAGLWPDGFVGCADGRCRDLAVTVHADRLGFEYPTPDFYDELQVTHDHLQRSHWVSAGQVSSSVNPFSATSEAPFDWSSIELPYQDDVRAAVALSSFYRMLFQQIAMPLSTHGSWKAIRQQMDLACERAKQLQSASALLGRRTSSQRRSSWQTSAEADIDSSQRRSSWQTSAEADIESPQPRSSRQPSPEEDIEYIVPTVCRTRSAFVN